MFLRVSLLSAAALVSAATTSVAQTVPVSVATDGTAPNGDSRLPAISGTGRFVAFASMATNLVPGDTNGVEDVFLRDRDTDADGTFDEPGAVSTIRVSQRGAVQGNGASAEPAITADGRYVVFTSLAASLLTPGQPPLPVPVVLRWDRLSGEIVLVSQTAAGEPLLARRSAQPGVSDDGNSVVFLYGGSTEQAADPANRGVVYRRDIAAASLTEVSTVPLGDGVNRADFNDSPSISGDGSTIAYAVVTRQTPGVPFVLAGTVYVVNAATNVIRASYTGAQPRLSRDGAFLGLIGVFSTLPGAGGPVLRVHLASGERRGTALASLVGHDASMSPSGRYFTAAPYLADFQYGSFVFPSFFGPTAFDDADSMMALAESAPAPHPFRILVTTLATLLDADHDGLNDHWEGVFGLDASAGTGATGASGAAGDPDGDGLTNAEEFARGSSPTGTHARFLAEGSAGSFFTTRIAIANPTDVQANVAVRFELAGGGTVARTLWVPAHHGAFLDSRANALGTSSFSTVVESTQPVAVDRLMSWGVQGLVPYGSHAETASAAPGTSWFLAEGSTVLGFQLFYLLQNPQASATTATVRYLLPSGAPIVHTYDLPPRSRTTIYVNTVPGLEATDVSASISATQPIAVERAMYRSAGGRIFTLGHDAAAVAQPALNWFFGEGATGSFFDTYLLIANPSPQPATVQADYLRDAGGPISRTYNVPAEARFTAFVDADPDMTATSFGTRVTSNVPVVAERAMYWAGGFFDYYEGHVSTGATQAGSHWLLAEGEQGGAAQAQMFVLIANTASAPATVIVRTLPDLVDGPVTAGPFTLAANARLTVPMASVPGYVRGGIEVIEQGTSTGALVVEGALYWNADGVPFAAGANWPATLIP